MWDVIDCDTGRELFWSNSKFACDLFVIVNKALNCRVVFVPII